MLNNEEAQLRLDINSIKDRVLDLELEVARLKIKRKPWWKRIFNG